MDIILTPEELRVLGCLLEKEMATPEYYPLTLNALLNACNQKTSRYPVVSYNEKTVLSALSRLQEKRLVWRSDLGRVPKYEEFFVKNYKLINSEAAILCILMLRGSQTIGEIKAHTERLYEFADLEKVNVTLNDLIEAGYIIKAPRQPGQKESRYSQLLSGQGENIGEGSYNPPAGSVSIGQEEDVRISKIEEELQILRQDFEDFKLKMNVFMEQFK